MTTEQLKQGNDLQSKIASLDEFLQQLHRIEGEWNEGKKCTIALGTSYADSTYKSCPSITQNRDSQTGYIFSSALYSMIDRTSYELEQLNNQLKAL